MFVGIIALTYIQAATNTVPIEAEAGAATNTAQCQDASASNGTCVKFKAPAPVETLYDQACSAKLVKSTPGTIQGGTLTEISGAAASRTQSGVYWVHNDSGDSARFFAINLAGQTLGTFNLTGTNIKAQDYEDMAIGPGPIAGQDYIYLADIGSARSGAAVQIYRVKEPIGSIGGATQSVSADRIDLNYPDGGTDAEAFFVDPRDGAWYIIQKKDMVLPYVYKIAGQQLAAGSTGTLAKTSSTFAFTPGNANEGGTYQKITSADMSPDGNTILVRTYSGAYLYDSRNKSVEQAFAGTMCRSLKYSEHQGEAVAVKANSRGFISISENGGSTDPVVRAITSIDMQ